MQVLAVIPARFASTRYPGKPLLRETGKYLIQHVCERAAAAKSIQRVIVATDDQRIFDAVKSFGGEPIMTREDHPSGTDRIAEVATKIPGGPDDIILNVQGDEPEIEPAYLDRLVARMTSAVTGLGGVKAPAIGAASENPATKPDMGTLACPFPPDVDPRDPNCVKVVTDLSGDALYFSRSLIPYPRDATSAEKSSPCHLHLGVYAYRRDFLLEFTRWPPTPLEQLEKLEQLRVLEHGRRLIVERVERASAGIDTPADYAAFVARWNAGRSGR